MVLYGMIYKFILFLKWVVGNIDIVKYWNMFLKMLIGVNECFIYFDSNFLYERIIKILFNEINLMWMIIIVFNWVINVKKIYFISLIVL